MTKVPRALGLSDLVLLIPFLYLFVGLMKLEDSGVIGRLAGAAGLLATGFGLVAAFFPTPDVKSVAVFETKIALGVVGPTAIGWILFVRAQRATRLSQS